MIKVKKTKEYFQETCECGKEITGFTEAQVNQRMQMHKLSKEHIKKIK